MTSKTILILLSIVLLIIYLIMFYKLYKLKTKHENEKKQMMAMFKISWELKNHYIQELECRLKDIENQLMEVKNEN